MRNQYLAILIVGMTLGTAWAIRGQFGHEQGAAWAGAIGALSLVLVSGRKDWYSKMTVIALSSALGWGAGGMISYGLVVGYGRSDNFPNVLYGLLMLFVIGGLFGLLGGGLTGLTLESSEKKRVKWACLIAEMTAGGAIAYHFLVSQLGILMTPPRSEAWAICLGAGAAMLWHMARNKHKSPLRVALITALGAGFGFAFGNFLQVVGSVLEINFNMWNVMEYSIGFFGGIALGYGVFSSEWPKESLAPEPWENNSAIMITFILIPLIIFKESLSYSTLLGKFVNFTNPDKTSLITTIAAGIIIIVVILSTLTKWTRKDVLYKRIDVMQIFVTYFVAYIIISYLVKGAFAGVYHLNHHLYWANLIIIMFVIVKQFPAFPANPLFEINWNRAVKYIVVTLFIISLLALILINIHGEMPGAHNRF